MLIPGMAINSPIMPRVKAMNIFFFIPMDRRCLKWNKNKLD